jgi:hypothetical protein
VTSAPAYRSAIERLITEAIVPALLERLLAQNRKVEPASEPCPPNRVESQPPA